MNNIHLIELFPFGKTPTKQKHWMIQAEEEAMFARALAEAKMAQAQTNASDGDGSVAAGAGGSPEYDYFNPSLTANFSADSVTGNAPFTANFTNTSSPNALRYSTFIWNFGDGETSVATNPTHIFANTGSYTCSLQSVGMYDGSNTNTKTSNNYISASLPTLAIAFTADARTGSAPFTVQFTNTTNVVTSTGTNTYKWIFSGSVDTGIASSSLANPSYTFNSGSWGVALQVTGSWNIADVLTYPLYISSSI